MDRAVMLYAQQAIYHDLVQHANQASQRRISITLGANRLPVNQIGESQSPLAELQIEMNTEIVPCHSNHPAAKQACSLRRPALFGFSLVMIGLCWVRVAFRRLSCDRMLV